ncbi:Protein FAM210B-like Protein [Tribolium castaneum]|uniref:Protein FAM210B-like Protein n=1 Tax=Tribolium castaneum TaxID=7070 RepID=D6WJH8_TRICA|nr:PREDICTED: protein FAM210B [Tribolium castaneum]EFA03673.1 Protein FAM210B-like Protein [Tribolium castaneum]|eukprot:XP_972523.1 PREDICTED: protein FAM210B [Tribolium castaneum]
MYLLRNISKLNYYSHRNLWLLSNKSVSLKNSPLLVPALRLKNTQPEDNAPTSIKDKLKKAVAEYGSTVIVFHVGISLVSLGVCYVLVSSGLDAPKLIQSVGISGETATKVATNAGTFAVAYAVHKVFAPVRLGITLTATPFIVRYLRQVGLLKPPK